MTNEEFGLIVGHRCREISTTLSKKAKEYSESDDRLYNFKEIAGFNGISSSYVLWILMNKHLICVRDHVFNDTIPTKEFIDEKVGDIINYLILLEGIWAEERKLMGIETEDEEES